MDGKLFFKAVLKAPSMNLFPGGPWTMRKKKEGLKKKIVHEMVEYWINVAYLTLAFAAFTQHRRSLSMPLSPSSPSGS